MATLDRLAPPATSAPSVPAWSPRRAIAAALVVAAAIAVIEVFQSSGFASAGQQIQRLQAEQADSTARVHALEADVAALSSLDRIERQARDSLGMVSAKNITYIQVDTPPPSGPLLPRPILNTPAVATSPPGSWWQRLTRALRLP